MTINEFLIAQYQTILEGFRLTKSNLEQIYHYENLIKVVEQLNNRPILVESPLEIKQIDAYNLNQIVYRATQKMQWMTAQEYIKKFGKEPPDSSILKLLASEFDYHPDYNPDWAL